jgi:hypothetical protein
MILQRTTASKTSGAIPPGFLDIAGTAAALACALHCAVMPLALTLLPLAGLSFLAGEAAEWALVGLSAVLGTASLCLGYRAHRSRRALALLAAGLALLAAGRIAEEREWEPWGVPLVVAAGLTVGAAHLVNRRLCRACRPCSAAIFEKGSLVHPSEPGASGKEGR